MKSHHLFQFIGYVLLIVFILINLLLLLDKTAIIPNFLVKWKLAIMPVGLLFLLIGNYKKKSHNKTPKNKVS